MSTITQHSDIIIVGAGPAGLAFARFFKGTDLKLTLIEKSALSSLQDPAYDGSCGCCWWTNRSWS